MIIRNKKTGEIREISENELHQYGLGGQLNKLGVVNSLWNNIRANKGSGKKPTKEMLEQEKKIKAKAEIGMRIKNKQSLYVMPARSAGNGTQIGEVINDDMGQWKYPGEITKINSPNITMQGVPFDVLGVSNTGDTKLMKPGKNYKFKGSKVTEFPVMQNGGFTDFYNSINPDFRDTTNYNLKRAYELLPKETLDKWLKNPDKNHLPTVGYIPENNTYEFLKSKNHPTQKLELDWYNSNKAKDFRKQYDIDSTGDYYKYVPKMQDGGYTPLPPSTITDHPPTYSYDTNHDRERQRRHLNYDNSGFALSRQFFDMNGNPVSEIEFLTGYERPKQQPITIQSSKPDLLPSQGLGDIELIPFKKGTYFTRKRQNQEQGNEQFGRAGKIDYFDKKTGKLLGTYQVGGKLPKAQNGKRAGYSWSTQQAPNYQPTFQGNYTTSITTGNRPLTAEEQQLVKLNAEKQVQQQKEAEYAARQARIKESIAAQNQPLSAKNIMTQSQSTGDKMSFAMNIPFGNPKNYPVLSEYLNIADYINPAKFVGDMASGLGSVPYNIQQGNYGQAALAVAMPLGVGALGFDPLGNAFKIPGKLKGFGKAAFTPNLEGIGKGLPGSRNTNIPYTDNLGYYTYRKTPVTPAIERESKVIGEYGPNKSLVRNINGDLEWRENIVTNLEDPKQLEEFYKRNPQMRPEFPIEDIKDPNITPPKFENKEWYNKKTGALPEIDIKESGPIDYKNFLNAFKRYGLKPSQSKSAQDVLKTFRERVATSEGQKRLKNLGITQDAIDKISIVADPDELAYAETFLGEPRIGLNPDIPEQYIKPIVRHEIEHAGVQKGGMSAIDKSLEQLELRKTANKNVDWESRRGKVGAKDPSKIKEYLTDKQNATDYFDSGSGGKEKSAMLGELQQHLVDTKAISHPYASDEITPELIRNVYIDQMFDENRYPMRIFDIMKPTDLNFKLISDNLNKMLSISAPVITGVSALQNSKNEPYKYGGKISLKNKQAKGWQIID